MVAAIAVGFYFIYQASTYRTGSNAFSGLKSSCFFFGNRIASIQHHGQHVFDPGHCGLPTEVSRFLNNHSPERLPAILTTIVARHGSAPRSVGTKMLVLQDGTIIGTIGGGCMEAAVVRRALEMIHDKDQSPILYHGDLTGQDAEDDGMVCGGVVDILMERV